MAVSPAMRSNTSRDTSTDTKKATQTKVQHEKNGRCTSERPLSHRLNGEPSVCEQRKTQLLEKKYPLAPMARNEKEKRSKEAHHFTSLHLVYTSQVDLSRKEVGNVLSLKLSNDDGFGKFSAFDSIPAEEIRDPDT
eukprot:38386-Amorphochlora_amoeboformis.AAC.1